ncbi:hypothetical protein AB3S75_043283 [Citrus x aurantiifolia]
MLRFDCFCLCILELLLTESRASDTSLLLNLRHMGRYQRVKQREYVALMWWPTVAISTKLNGTSCII